MATKRLRPRALVQLAKLIGDIATRQVEDRSPDNPNQAAVELGRIGGLKGGKARAATLSAERKSEIARKAARKRWS